MRNAVSGALLASDKPRARGSTVNGSTVGENAGRADVGSEFGVSDLDLRDNGLGGTVDCDIPTRDCALEL
jgi:hypothetical protein